ncbi:unnamed protein product [Brassicogethes aeneus]|uniref:Fidgetin-like protein 1 n=1 Tax=Brassicogethes aeneus TaxID=1431903 RepID=A0A9P0FGQ8_BRAAE|nr:unnamed protein product [Brassicogethes aeneus]
MNNEKVLNHHQRLLFEECYDPLDELHKQRKITAHLYNVACKSESRDNVSYLLEENYKKYNTLFDKQLGNYNKKIQDVLYTENLKKNVLSSKLNINLYKNVIKTLPCSNQIKCTTSENVSEFEFQEFLQIFKDNSIANIKMNENKERNTFINSKNYENKVVLGKNNENTQEMSSKYQNCFKTARDELNLQNSKKNQGPITSSNIVGQKRKLGTRRNINSKFISPLLSNTDSNEEVKTEEWPSEIDERLKNIDPKMVELIKSEIMDCGPNIHWNDIAGLEFAKDAIQEAVVWPMLRPDIFTGLRRPPKGILLFGPPGTGKTLIGKCVASQSKSTFFSISASSLTSKWVGDGEKMVRALFTVARVHQPAVIFIDEIDSLLSQRSESEHESSRRIKTEFLVQLDGATTENEERILVIGATNRPQELDEAARRRFVKRLYIPLPDHKARSQLVTKLIAQERHELTEPNFEEIAEKSNGYSGADIRNLCSEASLWPIRSIDMRMIEKIEATEVRPLIMEDFHKALSRVRSSVSPKDLEQYIIWDNTYGSGCGF